MIGLTKLERKVLEVLEDLTIDAVGPSFDEIVKATGVASRGNVHRIVVSLEQKGRIRRLPYRSRAIEIIKPTKLDRIDLDSLSQADLLSLSMAIDARLDDLQAVA